MRRGVALVQICQGLDPHSRRSGSKGAQPPESVQRTALRAVCTIIDAFHFVPPGSRLSTAALPQPAADVIAQHQARQAAGAVPAGQEVVLPAAAAQLPRNGAGAANGAAAGAPAAGNSRGASASGPGQAEEGTEERAGSAAGDGEDPADDPQAAEEEADTAEAEEAAAAAATAKRGADLQGQIQKVLVGRVLPALLRMMHKVRLCQP